MTAVEQETDSGRGMEGEEEEEEEKVEEEREQCKKGEWKFHICNSTHVILRSLKWIGIKNKSMRFISFFTFFNFTSGDED